MHNYDYYKHIKNNNVSLRLHAAASIRIPYSTYSFRTLLPMVTMRPLFFAALSVDLHVESNTYIFRNNLQVRLSPIKSQNLRKYTNLFKRPSTYPSNSKYNFKSFNYCEHLCTKTITLFVQVINISIIYDSELN